MRTASAVETLHAEDNSWQQWWSQKGSYMGVMGFDEKDKLLILGPSTNSSASLIIQEVPLPASERRGWLLKWRLLHAWRGNEGPNDEVQGQVLLSEEDLRAAFCFAEKTPDHNHFMADRYGAHLFVIGRFIRQGPYLNVPGPGTSTSFDSNISVFVDHEIRKAVERLIAL